MDEMNTTAAPVDEDTAPLLDRNTYRSIKKMYATKMCLE